MRFILLAGSLVVACARPNPREAQVAGQFYPDDPAELRRIVTHALGTGTGPLTGTGRVRILIAPHAGYAYSGPVAGRAFRQVLGLKYDGIVVIGFTHRMEFSGASVDTRTHYATPLGLIPVDQRAVRWLLSHGPAVRHVEEAHANGEHSLEVMLPFLQVALGRFSLVPILMGNSTRADAEALAAVLASLAGRGDYLFVFSTDLSHYHPEEVARPVDERTVNALMSETAQAVDRLFQGGLVEACGRGPILTGLHLAAALDYPERRLLAHGTSGDTSGDRSRVVGYAAIAMRDRPIAEDDRISAGTGMALVRAARRALEDQLIDGTPLGALATASNPELSQARGVFVTLRHGEHLRGCVGRIVGERPLAESLPQLAVESALHDPRFPAVRPDELDGLRISVSVLTPPRRLQRIQDLVAGRDGLVLEADGRQGVFLPVVWAETGWTRAEFLRELASQKAGLDPDAWRRATLSVFQAQEFSETTGPPS